MFGEGRLATADQGRDLGLRHALRRHLLDLAATAGGGLKGASASGHEAVTKGRILCHPDALVSSRVASSIANAISGPSGTLSQRPESTQKLTLARGSIAPLDAEPPRTIVNNQNNFC
jgi:hypothetical protein